MDHQKQRKGKATNEKEAEFHSDTEAIYYSLQYFQHQHTENLGWAYSSVDEISKLQLAGDEYTAGYYAMDGWYKVFASCIDHTLALIIMTVDFTHLQKKKCLSAALH